MTKYDAKTVSEWKKIVKKYVNEGATISQAHERIASEFGTVRSTVEYHLIKERRQKKKNYIKTKYIKEKHLLKKYQNIVGTFREITKEAFKDNENVNDRFISEAKKLSKLSHNHIVNIFDLGILTLPYFVMEYVDSDNLVNFLRANSNLKRNDYLEILNQICDVLKYIHSNKIVHFDIKEENILIEKPLSAKGIKIISACLIIKNEKFNTLLKAS